MLEQQLAMVASRGVQHELDAVKLSSTQYSWSRSASYSHIRRGFIIDSVPLWQLATCKGLLSFSHGAREASRWSRKRRIGDSGLGQKCRVAA